MIKVEVTDRKGETRLVECAEDQSLMLGLKAAGFSDILAICGGMLSCGTCHIHVAAGDYERLEPPSEFELELLDMEDNFLPGSSRLSCQIPATPAIDGLSLTIATDG
jgi:2Fe-2S ferredoxin